MKQILKNNPVQLFKTTLSLVAILILSTFSARAQCTNLVTDQNFAIAIYNSCPTCIANPNNAAPPYQLTAAAATVNSLNVSNRNISSLQGLSCFTNLTFLNCNQNQLTSLPSLPSNLQTLWCGQNQLTSLPPLPLNLNLLYCKGNMLTTLPTLPQSLQDINCSYNQLSCLPTLPNSIVTLHVFGTLVTCLPNMPTAIQNLWPAQLPLCTTPCGCPPNFSVTLGASQINSCAPAPMTLTPQLTGGVAPFTYQWSNGSTGQSLSVSQNGLYAVTVTGANGCTTTTSTTVNLQTATNCATNWDNRANARDLAAHGFNDGISYGEEQGNLNVGPNVGSARGCNFNATVETNEPLPHISTSFQATQQVRATIPTGVSYGRSVWFRFVAPHTPGFEIILHTADNIDDRTTLMTQTTFNTALAVYQFTGNTPNMVAFDDDAMGANFNPLLSPTTGNSVNGFSYCPQTTSVFPQQSGKSYLRFTNYIPGETYWVQVLGSNSAGMSNSCDRGQFALTIQMEPPPLTICRTNPNATPAQYRVSFNNTALNATSDMRFFVLTANTLGQACNTPYSTSALNCPTWQQMTNGFIINTAQYGAQQGEFFLKMLQRSTPCSTASPVINTFATRSVVFNTSVAGCSTPIANNMSISNDAVASDFSKSNLLEKNEEIENNIVTLSPNPSESFVQIRLSEPSVTVEAFWVSDMTGKVIVSEHKSLERLDVSHLPIGVYTLRLQLSNKQTQILRFTKI